MVCPTVNTIGNTTTSRFCINWIFKETLNSGFILYGGPEDSTYCNTCKETNTLQIFRKQHSLIACAVLNTHHTNFHCTELSKVLSVSRRLWHSCSDKTFSSKYRQIQNHLSGTVAPAQQVSPGKPGCHDDDTRWKHKYLHLHQNEKKHRHRGTRSSASLFASRWTTMSWSNDQDLTPEPGWKQNLDELQQSTVTALLPDDQPVKSFSSVRAWPPSLKYHDPNLSSRLLLSPGCANEPHSDEAKGREKKGGH